MTLRLASPVHSRDVASDSIGVVLSVLWRYRIAFYLEPQPDGVTLFVHESEGHVLDSALSETPVALN